MARQRVDPKVASIPPGAPFLPTLVNALLTGELIEGFSPGTDPLALADATIWVPTRRAARELATEFVSRLDGEVALLPMIRALGDVDDDALFFDEVDLGSTNDLTEQVGGLERQLILARLISGWATSLNDGQRQLYDNAEILMPSSFADAAWFAQDLARLMDMVATEEVDWAELENLVPDDHADWWQITLEFLKIATMAWPALLQESGKIDGAALRAQHLRRQADIYKTSGSKGPVIAAGSTGSIPATADLLRAIAHMENGVVILPGLDRDIPDEVWQKIDLPDNERDESGTAPGHPQFGLKRLLGVFGIAREHIRQIGGIDDTTIGYARIRERIVSTALLPADATGLWKEMIEQFNLEQRDKAFASVSLVEASNEREEALAIALALREKLESKSATAALVTPDRNLARRVAVELRRFGLDVDDSAGQPLRNRPHGTFARLVLQVAYQDADPAAVASLIKHPLAFFGGDHVRTRYAARMLELIALRGAIVPVKNGEFVNAVDAAAEKIGASKAHISPSVRRLCEEDWAEARWLAARLDAIFGSLAAGTKTLTELTAETTALIEDCGTDGDGNLALLYDAEEGKALSAFLSDLLDQNADLPLAHSEWPDVFDALMGARVVRPTGGTHPRVAILGPLEARLQNFDRIVLGGLNEKTWPAASRNDPFLSRPMKGNLGLPPPERRTGLAAHDFQMLLGMEDVFVTRSRRVDNAPTVASRWLQRVLMVVGDETSDAMRKRGQRVLDWVSQIDTPNRPAKAVGQPSPKPPIAARPKGMSITDIETWIRDPYAIYAKHILKLAPLEPLIREADARERGTLYHAIFEEFIRDHRHTKGIEAWDVLKRIADHHFSNSAVPKEIATMWRPRFDTIADAFIEWHERNLVRVKESLIELKARTTLDNRDFELRGRADRIDILNDGTLSIIDYKTSGKPSITQVAKNDAPQLPLEAALARRGAFSGLDAADASELAYVRLRPTEKLKVDQIKAGDLATNAWRELELLVDSYNEEDKPYLSKARIPKDADYASDYDHLARILEWSVADGRGDQ